MPSTTELEQASKEFIIDNVSGTGGVFTIRLDIIDDELLTGLFELVPVEGTGNERNGSCHAKTAVTSPLRASASSIAQRTAASLWEYLLTPTTMR